MTVARSVADVLRDHVTLELEGIDRIYLNVYVPLLQSVGGIVWYLREHRQQPYASTAAVAPMTKDFVPQHRGVRRPSRHQSVEL